MLVEWQWQLLTVEDLVKYKIHEIQFKPNVMPKTKYNIAR